MPNKIVSKRQWRKLARLATAKKLRKGEHRLSIRKFREMTKKNRPYKSLPEYIARNRALRKKR